MTSTDLKIGLSSINRPSSRVLKPPGGGHSNIFAEPETNVNAPRPKYNQQNSTNLNACLGSTDANEAVVKLREEIANAKQMGEEVNISNTNNLHQETNTNMDSDNNNVATGNNINNNNIITRNRVPPGGHSSGSFW